MHTKWRCGSGLAPIHVLAGDVIGFVLIFPVGDPKSRGATNARADARGNEVWSENAQGAQVAAVHTAMMTFAWRLAHVKTIPQQDSAERAFNKLGRTFAAQVEALKRYRSRGDQTVRVEHVTVNEGGQAIVGNVAHRGGGNGDDGGGDPKSRGATNARADARGNEGWSENA